MIGALPGVHARYWHTAREQHKEEFEREGIDYTRGYLDAIKQMPIKRFFNLLIMNGSSARYQGAKDALDGMLGREQDDNPN